MSQQTRKLSESLLWAEFRCKEDDTDARKKMFSKIQDMWEKKATKHVDLKLSVETLLAPESDVRLSIMEGHLVKKALFCFLKECDRTLWFGLGILICTYVQKYFINCFYCDFDFTVTCWTVIYKKVLLSQLYIYILKILHLQVKCGKYMKVDAACVSFIIVWCHMVENRDENYLHIEVTRYEEEEEEVDFLKHCSKTML